MLVRLLCVLLFLALTAERPGDALLYNGMWRSFMSWLTPLFASVPGIHQPAWNVLVAALVPVCALSPGAFHKRAWPMDAALLCSVGAIALSGAWGVVNGGSGYWAYYQVGPLLIGLLMAFLLLAAVRSPAHLDALGTTIVAAAVLRALLALYFFFTFVYGQDVYPPHMTSHDDSPLFAVGVVVVASRALARPRLRSWLTAAFVVALLLLAMKVNNRRVVYFEFVLSMVVLYLLLPEGKIRKRVNLAGMVLVPVLALYAAVGWGRQGALFAPLRAFGSTTGQGQDSSSLARNEENLNLIITYVQQPLIGSGWGHQFVSVSSWYAYFGGGFDEMYRYTPHNSLAALVAFTGIAGLIGTWCVMPVIAFLGSGACRAARDPSIRAAAMTAVCIVPIYGVHTYADIGLQAQTNALLLAVAIATAGRASVMSGWWPGGSGGARKSAGP